MVLFEVGLELVGTFRQLLKVAYLSSVLDEVEGQRLPVEMCKNK